AAAEARRAGVPEELLASRHPDRAVERRVQEQVETSRPSRRCTGFPSPSWTRRLAVSRPAMNASDLAAQRAALEEPARFARGRQLSLPSEASTAASETSAVEMIARFSCRPLRLASLVRQQCPRSKRLRSES